MNRNELSDMLGNMHKAEREEFIKNFVSVVNQDFGGDYTELLLQSTLKDNADRFAETKINQYLENLGLEGEVLETVKESEIFTEIKDNVLEAMSEIGNLEPDNVDYFINITNDLSEHLFDDYEEDIEQLVAEVSIDLDR